MADKAPPGPGTGATEAEPWDQAVTARAGRPAARGRMPRAAAPSVAYVPWLLICLAVVYDLATPLPYTAAPLLGAAPPAAAATLSLRGTVLVALTACGTGLTLALARDANGHPEVWGDMGGVALVALITLLLKARAERSSRQLATVRDVVEVMQRAVLPDPPTHLAGLRVAARYRAAGSESRIGGDFLAVQDTPVGVRVMVGDVRGKGIGAITAVTIVLGAFRALADLTPRLDYLVEAVEESLNRDIRRRSATEDLEGYATAVLAQFTLDRTRVELANRGHPPPILLTDGRARLLEPPEWDVPLGMGELRDGDNLTATVDFPPGASLVVFTDGITEARDRAGAFYEPQQFLHGRSFTGPEELLDALLADVARHSGGRSDDDQTLVAITRLV